MIFLGNAHGGFMVFNQEAFALRNKVFLGKRNGKDAWQIDGVVYVEYDNATV